MRCLTPCTRPGKLLRLWFVLVAILFCGSRCDAVTRPHVITFGKWISAKWPNATGEKMFDLKVRALMIDARVKESTTGNPHEITDRLFVVRRAFRMNDSLPEEPGPHWLWQRGGWLLLDRTTGRVSPINLPEFDAFFSVASWYRDYAAYCGVSDDGKKISAIVVQLGRRRPVLNKELSNGGVPDDAPPDSACPAPLWQRGPARVSFQLAGGTKQTFAIRGHVVDVVNDTEEEDDGSK